MPRWCQPLSPQYMDPMNWVSGLHLTASTQAGWEVIYKFPVAFVPILDRNWFENPSQRSVLISARWRTVAGDIEKSQNLAVASMCAWCSLLAWNTPDTSIVMFRRKHPECVFPASLMKISLQLLHMCASCLRPRHWPRWNTTGLMYPELLTDNKFKPLV